MSIFDQPRINFSGSITLNPGTANNADYSGAYHQPTTGKNLALIDAVQVMPIDFDCLDDAELIEWIQQPHTFDPEPGSKLRPEALIPAEWNYYGTMSAQATCLVTGVQAPHTNPDADALHQLVGQPVSWNGNITDVNPEGSPPATQFFAKELSIADNGIPRPISKAACLWIYFTRNVNMASDAGAGGYMYHVIPGGHAFLPGYKADAITGLVFRYCIYGEHGITRGNQNIVDLYRKKATNPATFQVTGSIAPLIAAERNTFGPVGRFLTKEVPNIPVPAGNANNANSGCATKPSTIALAPAVARVSAKRISVECLASFPEQFNADAKIGWDQPDLKNPKFDFGPVDLEIAAGEGTVTVGALDYADTASGNAAGWVFDFDIAANTAAQDMLSDPNAVLRLRSRDTGDLVLIEADYHVTTNQLAVYGEQDGSDTHFLNQGQPEPITIQVWHRGRALEPSECPPVTAWRYSTTPLGERTQRIFLRDDLKPVASSGADADDPDTQLALGTTAPGTYLITFAMTGQASAVPPDTYNEFIAWPFTILNNRAATSVRVLPNEDFSCFLDMGPDGPVGNDKLTFEVLYRHVLRNYYILFPGMNAVCPLNDPARLTQIAQKILIRTDPKIWMSSGYMPITRDLSQSRRDLLHAWCRKVLREAAAQQEA